MRCRRESETSRIGSFFSFAVHRKKAMSSPVCTLISATVEPDPTGRDAVKVACDHCGSFGLTAPVHGVLLGAVPKPAAKRAGFDLFKLDDRAQGRTDRRPHEGRNKRLGLHRR